MHTITAYERQQSQASRLTPHLKLEVQNGSGTWKDVGALLGGDYLVTGSIDVALDRAVSSASFALRRKVGAYSLSPLMVSSALNVDDASAYAPLLDIGRLVRASSATTEAGILPGTNLLLFSEQFDNAAWAKGTVGAVTANAGTAPDGTTTADKFTTNGVGNPYVSQNPVTVIGQAYQRFIFVKADTSSTVIFEYHGTHWAAGGTLIFNVATGGIGGSIATAADKLITVGGGWFLCYGAPRAALTVTAPHTVFVDTYGIAPAGKSVYLWGAQMDPAATRTQYVQTTSVGGLTSWKEGFSGRIDSVAWESDPITITCSDLGAWLMDTQIETEGVQYGTTPTGTALQTVIQNILNAWPSGKGIPTLFTPTSPGYLVTSWAQGRTKVLDAIRSVALQSTGWDVRFRYDAAGVSRLTLTDPQRSRVTVDATIAASEYKDVRALSLSIANVRNVGKLPYVDAAGAPQSATASDSVSISKYGRRYFELASSNAITTSTQANGLIASVVSDLAGAPAEQEIVSSLLWFVQLYDRYTFTANGVHYDADQTLAVVGYRHEFGDGAAWTTLRCTGRVVGAYADWLRGIALRLEVIEPSISAVATETATTGTLVLTPTDPQGRLTRVQMATASGNAAMSAYADVALSSGVYTGTVPLVEKQPSKIAWRMYAAVGNSEQLLDGDVVRYAIGGIPLEPKVSYEISASGLLSVIVKGDSSTTNNRVVIATDAQPTDAQVDASTSLVGRDASVTQQLVLGQRFYVGAKSYNTALGGTTASQGSPLVPQSDQWLGPSVATASVTVTSVSASPTVISLLGLTFGPLTTHVNVYVREYRTDPGGVASVVGSGYRLGPARTTTAPILIPVANPSNYIVVTLEAVDAQDRVGAGSSFGLTLPGGTVTLKLQAAAVAGGAPTAFVLPLIVSAGSGLVTLQIQMPATGLPATVRVWRNDVVIQEVPATAPSTLVTINDTIPLGTYTYMLAGVSAVGVLGPSVTSSPVVYAGGTLAAPTIVSTAWNTTKRGFDVTVTPGAGMPSNVFWGLFHSSDGVNFNFIGYFTSTTIFHAHDVDGTPHAHYFSVFALANGWTTSALAYDGGGASPGTNRPIPATA